MNVVHYTYLGKYLNLSYVLKKENPHLKPKPVYKIIKKKGFNRGETTRIVQVNKKLIDSFFDDYKSYHIDASVQICLKNELNEDEAALTGHGLKTIPIMEIERAKCECGCKDIAVDHFHGETFCPECGLVRDNNLIDLTAKMNNSF